MDRRQYAASTAGAAAFLNLNAVQGILPELATALHVTTGRAAWLFAAGQLSVAVTAPFVGAVSNKYGRKPVIMFSVLAMAVCTLLTALASSFAAMLFLRALSGVFIPGVFTTALTYIGEEWDTRGVIRTTALYVSGTLAGGFAARFLAGLIVSRWNWQAVFIAFGIIDFLLAGVLSAWLTPSRNFRPKPGGLLKAYRDTLKNPRLLAASAVGALLLFSLVAVYTYLPFRLTAAPYYLTPVSVGSLFVMYLLPIFTNPLASRAIVKYGRGNVALWSGLVVIATTAATLLPSVGAILLSLALFTVALFAIQTTAAGYATQNGPFAVGIYTTFYYIGGSLGAVAPATLWHASGWVGVVSLVIVAQLASCLLVWWLWPVVGYGSN